eukprot:1154343-Pelagomonas_calceolata.AAC.2
MQDVKDKEHLQHTLSNSNAASLPASLPLCSAYVQGSIHDTAGDYAQLETLIVYCSVKPAHFVIHHAQLATTHSLKHYLCFAAIQTSRNLQAVVCKDEAATI